jgi:hypothetical protein
LRARLVRRRSRILDEERRKGALSEHPWSSTHSLLTLREERMVQIAREEHEALSRVLESHATGRRSAPGAQQIGASP